MMMTFMHTVAKQQDNGYHVREWGIVGRKGESGIVGDSGKKERRESGIVGKKGIEWGIVGKKGGDAHTKQQDNGIMHTYLTYKTD